MSMCCSFLLCSCTRSLFISITNSSDSCSDSQNAPGLPWAWGGCKRGQGHPQTNQLLRELGPSHTHLDVPLQVLLERGLLDSGPQLVVNLQLCRQPLYLPLQVRRRITPSALTHLPTIPCRRVPALCVTFRASSAAWNFSVSSVCSCSRLLCSSADKHTRSDGDAKRSVETLYSHRPHVATFYVPLVLLRSSFTLLFVQHVQVGRRLRFHLENPVT